MKSNKIVYRIAILLSAFFVLNCGGLSTTNGGGHAPGPGSDGGNGDTGRHGGGNNTPPKAKTCAEQGLSTDNTGACFKAEATPANFQELVDIIAKKYTANHNVDLNNIDVSKITNMHCLFGDTVCKDFQEGNKRPSELTGKDFHLFNGKIDKWNVSNVTGMTGMFKDAISFNQDISGWDVRKVETMVSMFTRARLFNQDISQWKVNNVTNMTTMFDGAISFNQDIGGWNVGNVVSMYGMFDGAKNFNQDISGWNVSNVMSMNEMFDGASKFNQDLDKWDVRKVRKINGMFRLATAMSYPLPSWGGKLPANAAKETVFSGSAVATGNNYPSWCVSTGFGTGCR